MKGPTFYKNLSSGVLRMFKNHQYTSFNGKKKIIIILYITIPSFCAHVLQVSGWCWTTGGTATVAAAAAATTKGGRDRTSGRRRGWQSRRPSARDAGAASRTCTGRGTGSATTQKRPNGGGCAPARTPCWKRTSSVTGSARARTTTERCLTSDCPATAAAGTTTRTTRTTRTRGRATRRTPGGRAAGAT